MMPDATPVTVGRLPTDTVLPPPPRNFPLISVS